ncbi:hypothetical protein LCGC14_3096610 [marine sediment metagenome]|uniref:Uncharacterized protein n=1 Tax=marine sediment metagenome TaxID=412755 RepID=A0A0F8WXS5_9ZZZZ
MAIKNVIREPGFITYVEDNGRSTRYPIADDLRATDIPTGLTYLQLSAVTTVANLVVVLIRTLIARGVIGEDFMEEGDFSLEAVIQSIESIGGDYGEPDLSVT